MSLAEIVNYEELLEAFQRFANKARAFLKEARVQLRNSTINMLMQRQESSH